MSPIAASRPVYACLIELVIDKRRLIGAHLPFPGTGFVERKDGAYRFVPT